MTSARVNARLGVAECEMAQNQLLIVVLAATVAGILFARLYGVFGRRTGTEREAPERYTRVGGAPVTAAPVAAPVVVASDPVSRGLMDIHIADRAFEKEKFLTGARQAYETVVTAFARNDREALRPLLSPEVFAAFDTEMTGREQRGETTSFKFSGFRDTHVTHAELKDRTAEIAVSFAAQFISATMDASGQTIAGDPVAVRDVVDDWTFSRDVASSDPNWTLVGTVGPEAH
jgi:predicted lipid-binding transport protein (Tim44 family)